MAKFVEILNTNKDQQHVNTVDGSTPLMVAVTSGQLDFVKLLIESGVDIDRCESIAGMTALMQAIVLGYVT